MLARLLISSAGGAVALTGAGVSTASGIPDFRSAQGLWATANPAEVASAEALRSGPQRFWEFYRERYAGLSGRTPNRAHQLIAQLQERGLLRGVITQNVDGFHQAAGSQDVIEMHGTLADLRCMICDRRYTYDQLPAGSVPRCMVCDGVIRPGVVLFGEALDERAVSQAFAWAQTAPLLLAFGTSLRVAPASQLPTQTLISGGTVAIFNDSPTPYDTRAVRFDGDLTVCLEQLIEAVGRVHG
jgi:NAD-dependent deacetylase